MSKIFDPSQVRVSIAGKVIEGFSEEELKCGEEKPAYVPKKVLSTEAMCPDCCPADPKVREDSRLLENLNPLTFLCTLCGEYYTTEEIPMFISTRIPRPK